MINEVIALALLAASQNQGLPPGLLSAVCYVESKHNTRYYLNKNDGRGINPGHSLGECQVKRATARMLGYRGSEERLKSDVKVNTYYAAKYLKHQLDRYGGDIPKAIAAYNAGTHRVNKKGLTRNRKYVTKVMKAWSEGK